MTAPARGAVVVALAALLTVALTASLGVWQLSRAAQKQALEDRITANAQLPPWHEAELTQARELSEGFYRNVDLSGEWVQGHSVFLENRPMDGHSGFIVVTPLRLAQSGKVILVQRGWVPRDFVERARLPQIDTPSGPVALQGRLGPPPSQLFELGEAAPGPIRQNIDIAGFSFETGLPLMAASVLQTSPPDRAFQRNWPRFAAGVQMHHGYAFQWFAMSLATIALYLWFQIFSPRRKRRRHGPESR